MRNAAKVSEKCQIDVGNVSTMGARRYLSVTQIAAALGYSRDRFYQLRRNGVFPMPEHQVGKRRVYHHRQLEACRRVILTGIGVNGTPVMLRKPNWPKDPSPERSPRSPPHARLMRQLKNLGFPCNRSALDDILDALPYQARDGPPDQLIRHVLKSLTAHLLLQPPHVSPPSPKGNHHELTTKPSNQPHPNGYPPQNAASAQERPQCHS